MADTEDRMKGSTALLILAGTAALVVGTLFVLDRMQPVVLRGVAVSKALRNGRTLLTVRAMQAPETVLASAKPKANGCFSIPLQDVAASGELMLHAKRGRTRAVISPVGPHAATEFAVTLDTKGKRPQLVLSQADGEIRSQHAGCFGP